ncbi:PQQ-binding-like beta-propeller repeat protein [Streptomyces sp. NPDC050658]|uniref:outer membrane protein assembly factor BamB family protein n=1 Tax=unclassified Streptomyces TaxID=2593676 RepID=UPI0034231815
MVNRESGPPHKPVPGNPYAQPTPPATGGGGRGRGILLGAAALTLVLVGAGTYALTRDDGDGSREPVAAASKDASDGGPSATPERDTEAQDDGKAAVIDVNAGRKPGEAKAWLAMNEIKLPGKGARLYDPWRVPGIVAQAEHNEVTGYRTTTGKQAWTVPLPGEVCDTPVNPTPDGKVVVAYTERESEQNKKCDQLQVIDLKSGAKGWHKPLVATGTMDDTSMTTLAISGGAVVVNQDMIVRAYRISDGKRLFTAEREKEGGCYATGVAGGARLLEVGSCGVTDDTTRGRLRKLDPRTGDVKWRYWTKKGWNIQKVYSVDPVVVAVKNREDMDKWAVVAVDDKGKERSWTRLDKGPEEIEMCAGAGDSGEGMQNCPGAAVAKDRIYLESKPTGGDVIGPNRVVAFDLAKGKRLWGAEVKGKGQLTPVAASGGDRPGVIVYARAWVDKTGQTLRIGPDGGKPEVLLRHTEAARPIEVDMTVGYTLYAEDRLFVSPSSLEGKNNGTAGEEGNPRMLSFGR